MCLVQVVSMCHCCVHVTYVSLPCGALQTAEGLYVHMHVHAVGVPNPIVVCMHTVGAVDSEQLSYACKHWHLGFVFSWAGH